MPSRKAVRPDDGRLEANRTRKRPKPPPSRWQLLISGEITVDDLDDDEIRMGQCKDKNGNFGGSKPKMIPRALNDGLRREFQRRIQEKINQNSDIALKALMDIAQNPRAAAPARVRAAELLLERTIGKVPDKVESTMEVKPFEEDVEKLLVDLPLPGAKVTDVNAVRRRRRAAS